MDTNYILILICFAQLGTIIGFMIRFHFRIKELETKTIYRIKKTGKWIIYSALQTGTGCYHCDNKETNDYWTNNQKQAKTFETFDEAQKYKLDLWATLIGIYPIEQTEEVKNN